MELAGLPGSGKSTLMRLLKGRHPHVEWRGLNPVLPRELMRHPAIGTEAAGLYAVGRIAGLPNRPAMHVARWIAALKIGADSCSVLEGGPVNFMWGELFWWYPGLLSKRWQWAVRQTHPLVVLRVDREERTRRVASKIERGPINRQLAEHPDLWPQGEELFETVLSATARRRVVEFVDTSGTVEDSLARLEATLAHCGVELADQRYSA